MISLDKLKSVKHLITHANCADGIASALILKDALPGVHVSFMRYDTQEHKKLAPEPGMLFVDFTPYIPVDPRTERRDELLIRLWRGVGVLVLDHHPTVKDIVEAFGENGVFGLNEKNECGAWLAYEHVWLPLREAGRANPPPAWDADMGVVKRFAELAAIYDTWKKNDPSFEEAGRQSSMLTFLPLRLRSEMKLFEALAFCKDEKLAAIIRERDLDAARKSLEEGASFTTSKGTRGIMFQGVAATSDAAEIQEQYEVYNESIQGDAIPRSRSFTDLIVGFRYRVDAGKLQLQFSMRSHTGYDVGAFAKSHPGGGGHKAAAGFTVDVSPEVSANPYAVFRLLLEEWEGGQ